MPGLEDVQMQSRTQIHLPRVCTEIQQLKVLRAAHGAQKSYRLIVSRARVRQIMTFYDVNMRQHMWLFEIFSNMPQFAIWPRRAPRPALTCSTCSNLLLSRLEQQLNLILNRAPMWFYFEKIMVENG